MSHLPKMPPLTANAIGRLLAARHAADVFVTECKDGPTHAGSHLRMDAWAMRKSWSNPCATAYEIKVARRDFMADEKWRGYLRCCNEFYFVCPAGMINVNELPEQVGLVWASASGTKLYTKRKAAFREVLIPDCLWRYILMARSKVMEPGRCDLITGADYWRWWLANRDEERSLGDKVSRTIRKHVVDVETENERLKCKMEEYDAIREVLKELGFENTNGRFVGRHQVENRVQRLRSLIGHDTIEDIAKVGRLATELAETLGKEVA